MPAPREAGCKPALRTLGFAAHRPLADTPRVAFPGNFLLSNGSAAADNPAHLWIAIANFAARNAI